MRVAIAEDLFLLRDGLTRMLEAHGFAITAAVDNGDALLAALREDPETEAAGVGPSKGDEDVQTETE